MRKKIIYSFIITVFIIISSVVILFPSLFSSELYCRKIRKPAIYSVQLKKIILQKQQFIIDRKSGELLARPNLEKDEVLKHDYTDEELVTSIKKGDFQVKTEGEIIKEILNGHKDKAGIVFTGGGDSAGIASFLSSLSKNISDKKYLLGVKNAGAGLSVSPEEFSSHLVIIDDLLAEEISNQSSTPLGSSRVNPLKESKENTMSNIKGFDFVIASGGDDHLSLLEEISKEFPDMVVAGTFKSIDGDGSIGGVPAQMLGFHTAVKKLREEINSIAQSTYTHRRWSVVEVFGRNSGRLAFHAAKRGTEDLLNYFKQEPSQVKREEKRKSSAFKDTIMILVPEKPTSFRSIANKAKEIKKREGSVTLVVSEGFIPPELRKEVNRLAKDEKLKKKWLSNNLSPLEIPHLIKVDEKGSPKSDLKNMLKDNLELAVKFAKNVWETKVDQYGNVKNLSGIRRFITQALKSLVNARNVREALGGYELRGATPDEYDLKMGMQIGKVTSELISEEIAGGKAVIYFSNEEPMNPFILGPAVIGLVGVSDKNNLNNQDLYPEETLRENGVFWKKNTDN